MQAFYIPGLVALLCVIPGHCARADGLAALHEKEVHLRNLRQVTFGGENAEAYWSFDGKRLTLQRTAEADQPDRCDQIYLLDVPPPGMPMPAPRLLTPPHGRATCSYFFPDNSRVLFSSTRAAGDACPPPPDRSKGYVWPLYPYQIYTARLDGSDIQRVTQTPGYEAESTVCHDGSVIFTSDRDGDLELYRMRLDGTGLTRLTHAPGYDGGAFFSEDCKRIVWRADHPRNDTELKEMKALLGKRLVRPTRMEIWVADADGTSAHQVTDLHGASFAPFFYPQVLSGAPGKRIIFSSNHIDPQHREFDLWAVNDDGTALERITYAPEFDGFPMFSPDGTQLAFSSNRGGSRHGETNVFLAEWKQGPSDLLPTPADLAHKRVAWLADPARQGRGVGTRGLSAAGDEIARWMKDTGLSPAGETVKKGRTYFQTVDVFVGVRDTGSKFLIGDGDKTVPLPAADLAPAPMSESARFDTEVPAIVFAGYGITAPEARWDDLRDLPLKGQVALVLRGTPDKRFASSADRSYSDLRYKAWNLREHGARAVIFFDLEKDGVPRLVSDGPEGGAGLPVVFASKTLVRSFLSGQKTAALDSVDPLQLLKTAAEGGKSASIKFARQTRLFVTVSLSRDMRHERNVIGLLPGAGAAMPAPGSRSLESSGDPGGHSDSGAIVLGAHYDHLGLGGQGSFAPDQRIVHPGADDNASGTTALLTAAIKLAGLPRKLPQDVYFVAFTGEEVGLVGSGHFVQHLIPGLTQKRIRAMINFDMVGRLGSQKGNTLPTVVVQGTDSAAEWPALVQPLCQEAGLLCRLGGDGYGPSDMTPFYAAGIPVLFFFTGAHADYHRPSDTADKINAQGIVQIAHLATSIVSGLSQAPLTFKQPSGPAPRTGDSRGYGAYLGTIPDYTAMQGAKGGVKLSGARPGSPADQAGVRSGDVLVGLADHDVSTLEDMAFVLRTLKPGQSVDLVLYRDGKKSTHKVTVGERPK